MKKKAVSKGKSATYTVKCFERGNKSVHLLKKEVFIGIKEVVSMKLIVDAFLFSWRMDDNWSYTKPENIHFSHYVTRRSVI